MENSFIIISITAPLTLKNLKTFNIVYYDDTRMYVKNKSISKYIINN